MSDAGYRPEPYWTRRFQGKLDLDAVGYQGLGVGLNSWMYRCRRRAVRALLRHHGVPIRGECIAEMGVGSGYWVAEWHRQGAGIVFGVDVTSIAVETLARRFPTFRFVQRDLGVPGALTGLAEPGRFGLAVAMEVLLHIPDPDQFSAALDSLTSLVAPGGFVLLSDLFLPLEVAAPHQLSRTLAAYEEAMRRRGFRLVGRRPVFFLLHPSDFTRRGVRRWLAGQRWRWLTRLVRLVPATGWVVGAPLYLADTLLQRVARDGPSTHLTLWQRA